MKTVAKLALWAIVGLLAFGLMLFLPAGTLHYWQGWVFLAVFALFTWIPNVYLLRTNPAALERRMHAGPRYETRMPQKIISSIAFLSVVALILFSVIDHRFGWSTVSAAISVIGDVLVAIGLGLAMLVVIQNGYAAANISLGSYWGLVFMLPGLVVLALRIRDEEGLLERELRGYSEYEQQVHYRLVPYVW
jgi:protein-S-isoprenylcysteine O-methyltransferase Ste14